MFDVEENDLGVVCFEWKIAFEVLCFLRGRECFRCCVLFPVAEHAPSVVCLWWEGLISVLCVEWKIVL